MLKAYHTYQHSLPIFFCILLARGVQSRCKNVFYSCLLFYIFIYFVFIVVVLRLLCCCVVVLLCCCFVVVVFADVTGNMYLLIAVKIKKRFLPWLQIKRFLPGFSLPIIH